MVPSARESGAAVLASDGKEFYSGSTDIDLFLSRYELVHGCDKSDEEKAVDIRGL